MVIKIKRLLARLRSDQRGVAFMEFAFATPIVLTMGLYGLEVSNLAMVNLRASQIASNLADTTSRIGENIPFADKRIREADINDAFEAVRQQAGNMGVISDGQVRLSSLEQNTAGGQWIHWQRCIGMKAFPARWGVQGTGATGTAFQGMGDPPQLIQAPQASAVMFVEVAFDYQPLITDEFIGGPRVIRAKAAFLVRDRRDLSNANNPSNPAPAEPVSNCNTLRA